MDNLKKNLTIIFIIMSMVFNFSAVYAQEQDNSDNVKYFNEILKYIDEGYNYSIDKNVLLKSAIDKMLKENPESLTSAIEGAFEALDPYSTYIEKEVYDSFSQNVSGQFSGIGVVITKKDNYITIVSTIGGSPAEKAGIKTGDKIIAVNNENVEEYNLERVSALIKGETGSRVTIKVLRDDKKLNYKITRSNIKLSPIYSEILKNNIGYIKIQNFNSNASEFTKKAIKEFEKNQISRLIIDVRDNPGGDIYEAFKISSLFIPNGKTIINIKSKEKDYEPVISQGPQQNKYDIVLLINENSASASEILAAALKDNKEAELVGVKSFGKGTIQNVIPLSVGGGIKMTISEFYTPKKQQINLKGISPDYVINNEKKLLNLDEFETLTIKDKYTIGSKSNEVLAAEQRLNALGYNVGTPDEYFDNQTAKAVKLFQDNNNLYPYGVLDLTTQKTLNDVISTVKYTVDNQLEKAINLLN